MLLSERIQDVKQNQRVRAAGNSDENFLAAHQQPAVLDFAFGALEKFAHPASLHFFDAPGKRWSKVMQINYCERSR